MFGSLVWIDGKEVVEQRLAYMRVTLQVSPENGVLGPGEEAAMQVHFCPQEVFDCDRWATSHDLEENHITVAWFVGLSWHLHYTCKKQQVHPRLHADILREHNLVQRTHMYFQRSQQHSKPAKDSLRKRMR